MIDKLIHHDVYPPAILATSSVLLAKVTESPWLSIWGLPISTGWLAVAIHDRVLKHRRGG